MSTFIEHVATTRASIRTPVRASVHIRRLGPFAAMPDCRLHVTAVFDRSVYLHSDAGGLYCLCREDLPLGPFSLACDAWDIVEAAGFKAGAVHTLSTDERNKAYVFDVGLRLEYAEAVSWRPEPARWHPDRAVVSLQRLEHMLPEKAGGLMPLLAERAGHVVFSPLQSGLDAVLLGEGRTALADLNAWFEDVRLERNDGSSLSRAVNRLLGLGPGLTPSGDDVLAGMMLGFHACGATARLAAMADMILPMAEQRTNRISRAYLRAAAGGCGSEALHKAIDAVLADSADLEQAVAGLASVGHSSGGDALLGAVTAISFLSREHQRVKPA